MGKINRPLLLFAFAFVPVIVMYAGIRGPVFSPGSSSTSLIKPSPGLEIQRGGLDFRCDDAAPVVCRVNADYFIESKKKGDFVFDFVLPADSGVRIVFSSKCRADAKSDAKTFPVKDPALLKRLWKNRRLKRDRDKFKLNHASFTGRLHPGLNKLSLSYVQRPAFIERDYAGCYPCLMPKQGRFVHMIAHHLWPLKEWQLSPDFKVSLRVSIVRNPPSFFKRNFGKVRMIVCNTEKHARVSTKKIRQKGNRLIYSIEMGKDFPDSLMCDFGDEDLLPMSWRKR